MYKYIYVYMYLIRDIWTFVYGGDAIDKSGNGKGFWWDPYNLRITINIFLNWSCKKK